ncbi:hypothetical protein ACFX2C_003061 [Malus domestica]
MSDHEKVNFIDTYNGYNQIRMDKKTMEVYVDDMVVKIGKTMEVYRGVCRIHGCEKLVEWQSFGGLGRRDDMVVKSKRNDDHLEDLVESFNLLRKEGSRPNLNQIKAIIDMRSSRTVKKIQSLTGIIAFSSNNEVEYEALLAGLRITLELHVKEISIYCNSIMVANQVTGKYAAHDPVMALYLEKANEPLNKFTKYDIHQLPRMKNCYADALVNLGSSINHKLWHIIPFKYLETPIIMKHVSKWIIVIDERGNWMDEILAYIIYITLPDNCGLVRKVIQKASQYVIV